MNYKIFQLKDVCTRLSSGKSIKSEKISQNGVYPVFGGNGVRGYTDIYNFDGECAIIGRQGAFCGNVRYFSGKAYMTEHAVVVCSNEMNNTHYLAYLLSMMNLGRLSGQSAQPGLSVKTLGYQEINLPKLEYQNKVVKIISSLEEKIDINKRINDNLENFIKNLFKDTFYNNKSNFSYKKISLGDLMDYQGGSQPPSSEFINYKRNGYIRFIQIRDYDSNSHITYIPISSKNKICNEKDIMIARYGAALGKICCGLNGAYNVALAKVIPRKSFYREFLRNYLSSKEFYIGINNKGERSAQSGFNKSDIKSFELLFPKDEKIVIKFEKIASNCFELYLKNLKQNRTLENIRNKLLPYLISGKIDISDIELRH